MLSNEPLPESQNNSIIQCTNHRAPLSSRSKLSLSVSLGLSDCSNPSEQQHGSSKPPLGSSAVTSRILLRQQLMREQLQEQERREQQRRQSSAYAQPSVTQSPAINVSAPAGLPSATQVPMEVLKVTQARNILLGFNGSAFPIYCMLPLCHSYFTF